MLESKSRFNAPNEHVFGVRVHFESLPDDCIEEIIVNPEAESILPGDATFLCNPDILRLWAMATVKQNNGCTLSTYKEEGREIPLFSCNIWYGPGILGTHIGNKGVLFSGEKYTKTPHHSQKTPWGFFGNTSAIADMNFTNAFLAEGGRSSLSLGILILSGKKFRKWMDRQYTGYSKELEILHNGLEIVEKNGDKLAQEIRLTGPRCRIFSTVDQNPYNRIKKSHFVTLGVREGAHALGQEIAFFPNRFRPLAEQAGVMLKDVKYSLDRIRDHRYVHDIEAFTAFLNSYWEEQSAKIILAEQRNKQSITGMFYIQRYSVGKDINTSLILHDFEYTNIDHREEITTSRTIWKESAIQTYIELLHAAGSIEYK